ncbi:MAG: AAA family ATPase, partial [Pseudonocardia sp.]|nr:AAA family ATPase [Pseudonocardia sp.]
MHLKSLTLKGFKSFASATTLRLEPGITCVVGPNGSGKSNVVDAIAWVLGEQGAKAMRGGKMEDVIFAGTSGRAPLGRAEVTLTIDNSDGALPIDYAEVSITRRTFRDGAGEYEINGSACRLLDVQELLSDSGIGRELHVVVGQGQLDAVLQSKPEDRRAYIEEAAGVLKHRKRKEKALRKLDAMQANLTRLTDLTGELRRRLKPLGRQAEIARRAQAVQSQLRDARLRLAADDLVTLRDEIAREEADESAARARRAEVEQQLSAARAQQQDLEAALAADAPRLAAAQDTWYRLSALAERFAGTVRLARERRRHLAVPAESRVAGRDPGELEAEADAVAEDEELLVEAVVEARRALSAVMEERTGHERSLAAAERAHLAAVRALADRKAGLATLAGKAEALRSGAAATADEIERLSEALSEARDRAAAAHRELDGARIELGEPGEDPELDQRYARAGETLATARARVTELAGREREIEQQRAHWRARVDALSIGLARKDGSAALTDIDGVLGPLSGLVTVEPEARTAVAAALGELADALAVDGLGSARSALERLRCGDAGAAALLVADERDSRTHLAYESPARPGAGRWAAEAVHGDGAVPDAVRHLLRRTVIVPDLAAAEQLVLAEPALTAVTAVGDVLAAHRACGGSGAASSALDVQAAVVEADERRAAVEQDLARVRPALEGARAEEAARQAGVEAARRARDDAEQRRAAGAARLGLLEQAARAAEAEAARLGHRRDAVEARRSESLLALGAAERRLAVAEDEPVDAEPGTAVRDAAADALATSRSAEVDARLSLRTAEERARAIAGRAESLRRQAAGERLARERAAAARQARERDAALAALVADAGQRASA